MGPGTADQVAPPPSTTKGWREEQSNTTGASLQEYACQDSRAVGQVSIERSENPRSHNKAGQLLYTGRLDLALRMLRRSTVGYALQKVTRQEIHDWVAGIGAKGPVIGSRRMVVVACGILADTR